MFSALNSSNQKIKPTVLLVMDGWGVAPKSPGNAISEAKKPNFDKYMGSYPHGELIAAGESVGLPANEAGNSEVGHLTIGAGRVIYQSLPRINMAIEDETFYDNKAFLAAIRHINTFKSRLHLIGLVSSGTVHSANSHLYALMELCVKRKVTGVSLHLFTDGRDAPPTDGLNVIAEIQDKLEELNIGRIATITGRYYAMDRDGRWERTKLCYEAMVLGSGVRANDPLSAVRSNYQKGKTDEFIEPTVIVPDSMSSRLGPVSALSSGTVNDNDAVIFFNFRIDRPRQLTMAFTMSDFEKLKEIEFGYVPHEGKSEKGKSEGPTFQRTKWPKNLFFVTMTEYQKNLPVSAVAFPPQDVGNTLPEVISNYKLNQAHIAESEKERMVTFYFDGTKEARFPGEDVEIIASPNVATYDQKPEMSVFKLVKKFKKLIGREKYHFFVLNFANPDMVGHSGNLEATLKAIEFCDRAIGEIVEATLKKNGCFILTADHGNAEQLITYPTKSFFITSSRGVTNTEHSNNPVPILIVHKNLERKAITLNGDLSDVAPTILNLMSLPIPQVMTGRDLLAPKKEVTSHSFASSTVSPII